MNKKETDKIINEACVEVSKPLLALFYALNLKEHITATILNQENGDQFELSLKKLDNETDS